ncbi:lachesin-like [Cimex lectularius]|uniref:Ig-like domain-containing protein n=1 Tax=Cimex lectularius TaxID=79782 RepID=A0A8I6SU90_CIMLE|nr:lachesin-like [Cimex lectularius]
MGHYMCMASNGVPPAVSKRISINVHFAPVIQVPNQLVGAPLGTDVSLECYVEASPKAIIYWMKDSSDNMVVTSDKYETKVSVRSLFETWMMLKVHNFRKTDVGTYRCVAKNSLGEVERSIRLYEIPGPVVNNRHPAIPTVVAEDQEEDEDEGGSAYAAIPDTPPPRRQESLGPSEPPSGGASHITAVLYIFIPISRLI